jgi:17beta-estradiol 17-dehydrogenase / very-long-chain 3-oxoacyl-CoA reductase
LVCKTYSCTEYLTKYILVNNVGKSHDIPADFHEIPLIDHEDIVEINVNATIKVTRLIVPGMITR